MSDEMLVALARLETIVNKKFPSDRQALEEIATALARDLQLETSSEAVHAWRKAAGVLGA